MAIILSIVTFVSTFLGGILALRYRDRLHMIMGFTAGVLLGVVAFDIFPEITKLLTLTNTSAIRPMVALVCGFLLFHIIEKWVLIHQGHEGRWGEHRHPTVGIISALALCGHSFLDGVGIGLAFKISPQIGILVAAAVIAHDFSDGLNTVALMISHQNTTAKAKALLTADAIAPVLGAVSTLFFSLPQSTILIYLGFFAGFLLYIATGDILPEAHSKHSSIKTIFLTVLGTLFIYIVTRAL